MAKRKKQKQPAIQFYPGDWFKDDELGKCSPTTRGIWIDVLLLMAAGGRTGKLAGTIVELARVCRCSVDEMRAAAAELGQKKAADVRECHGVVTLINRRMQAEHSSRVDAAKRQMRRRKGERVTDVSRKCHTASSSSSSISSSSSDSPPTPAGGEGRVKLSPRGEQEKRRILEAVK